MITTSNLCRTMGQPTYKYAHRNRYMPWWFYQYFRRRRSRISCHVSRFNSFGIRSTLHLAVPHLSVLEIRWHLFTPFLSKHAQKQTTEHAAVLVQPAITARGKVSFVCTWKRTVFSMNGAKEVSLSISLVHVSQESI